MKTMIAIPCMDTVTSRFAASLMALKQVGDPCIKYFGMNSLIYDTRNQIAKMAIEEGCDRVLWLDIDTIVMKDIGEIFETDLTGFYAAMVEEPVRSKYPFMYFNAGVALMDLKRMRDGIYLKCIDLLNRVAYTAQDQDMLNLFCQGEIRKIHPQWNDAGHITEPTPDPYIRHFAGALKQDGRPYFDAYAKAEWRLKE